FADRGGTEFDPAHARLRGERHELGVELGHVAATDAVLVLGKHYNGTPFRRLVGERSKLGGIGQLLFGGTPHRFEFGGLPVAQGNGAGLIEQQSVDVARRLDGTARHCQNVKAHQPIHAGNADRRQQGADGGGNDGHEQGNQHDDRNLAAGVAGVTRQGRGGEYEDNGKPSQQNVEGNFIGGPLPLRPLDQADHAVEKG